MKNKEKKQFQIPIIIALFTIYFFSGLCSLIDEVVWVRLIKLSLGNTVYASSIVVSLFMGGLALGALIMGRLTNHIVRPLRTYAILEICASVLALSVPYLLKIADKGYGLLFNALGPSSTVLFLLQIIIAAIIILAPTMVMGSTLPLIGLFINRFSSNVGHVVGRLYAVNTLGAAAGCYLAGFLLIGHFGVMITLYIATAINVFIAIAGWLLSMKYDGLVLHTETNEKKPQNKPITDAKKSQFFLLTCCFAAGFISIGYELVWMRSIVIPMGGMTYVFSSVLTIYLVGNVLGAWIGSFLSKITKNPSIWFGISLSALGICGILFMTWFSKWIDIQPFITRYFGENLLDPLFTNTTLRLIHSSILFLPPSIVMGIGFPLALQSCKNTHSNTGLIVGNVYGANTIGAVLGGLLVGFFLIPKLGIQYSMTVLGLLGIWLGLTLLAVSTEKKRKYFNIVLLTVAVAITVISVLMPADSLEKKFLHRDGKKMLWIQEGTTTTVSVTQDLEGYRLLGVDGIYMAGDDDHRCAQKTLGHLGMLLNTNVKDVLSIGYGCGETSLCISYHNPGSIKCVEIAKEVTNTAQNYFSHINLSDRLPNYVTMYHMDAKNFLHLTKNKFDLIINDSDVHQSAGSAPLYTIEHFTNAKNHLNPDGLFITKLHIENQSETVIKSILATFSAAFPHVTIWFPTTKPYIFFYLVGSNDEQTFSPDHIDKEIAKPEVKKSLDYLNISGSVDLAAWYMGDEKDLKKIAQSGTINSDYYPIVEFNVDTKRPYYKSIIDDVRSTSLLNHVKFDNVDPAKKELWLSDFYTIYQGATEFLKTQHQYQPGFFTNLSSYNNSILFCPYQKGFVNGTIHYIDEIKGEIAQGDINADKVLSQLNQTLPPNQQTLGTTLLLKSRLYQSKEMPNEAMDAALLASTSSPRNTAVLLHLSSLFFQSNKPDSAVLLTQQAFSMDPHNASLLFDIGFLFDIFGSADDALIYYKETLKKTPDDVFILCYVGKVYARLNRKDDAVLSFKKALALFPDFKPAIDGLKEVERIF